MLKIVIFKLIKWVSVAGLAISITFIIFGFWAFLVWATNYLARNFWLHVAPRLPKRVLREIVVVNNFIQTNIVQKIKKFWNG